MNKSSYFWVSKKKKQKTDTKVIKAENIFSKETLIGQQQKKNRVKFYIWSGDSNIWTRSRKTIFGQFRDFSDVVRRCEGVHFGQWKSHNLCAKRKKISGKSTTTKLIKQNKLLPSLNFAWISKFGDDWRWKYESHCYLDRFSTEIKLRFRIPIVLLENHQKNTDFLMHLNVINRRDKDDERKKTIKSVLNPFLRGKK